MSYAEVYDQAHAWVVGVTGYDAGKVIESDGTGPRPELPYITIGVTSHDTPINLTDHISYEWTGVVQNESQRGARRASLSIQGYGSDSAAALELLPRTLQLSTTLALMDSMDVQSITGVTRTPVPLGMSTEIRYIVEATVVYIETTDGVSVPYAETIETTMVLDGTPTDITQTTTTP